jgi:hypothetical protein
MYTGEGLDAIGKRRGRASVGFDFSEVSKDVGCRDISDSCLVCPLPRCLWDYEPEERGEVRRRFVEWKRQQG